MHGEDFTGLETPDQLEWFREEHGGSQARYVVKYRATSGPDDSEDRAARILNRIFGVTAESTWYEPDQRHVEIITRECGLGKHSMRPGPPGYRRDRYRVGRSRSREVQEVQAVARMRSLPWSRQGWHRESSTRRQANVQSAGEVQGQSEAKRGVLWRWQDRSDPGRTWVDCDFAML